MESDLIPTREAVQRLGKSVSTICRMVANGELTPALRLDGLRGAMWFRPSDIEDQTASTTGGTP
jgi:predicted DNA-binding transcriptional regulator AlpA